MDTVIFACVHNAGRSQMAAGFFNLLADASRARAESAGTQPATSIHPVVVEAMREAGVDISHNRPQRLTDDLVRTATLLVTMGCGDQCPYVIGLELEDWPLRDPKDLPLAEVRQIRDIVCERVAALVQARNWSKTPLR